MTTTDHPGDDAPPGNEAAPDDETAPDDHHGLLIEADLTVELPTAVIQLHSEGDTLYVESRTFAGLRELRATASGEAIDWLRQLGGESPLAIDTPVIVRVAGVPVARYDPTRPPGWLAGRVADRLGISPLRPDLGGLLQAAWRLRRD